MCPTETLAETLLIGELSLDWHVRSVLGVLTQLRSARSRGPRHAIVLSDYTAWAALVPDIGHRDIGVRVAHQWRQVVEHFEGTDQLESVGAAVSRIDVAAGAADTTRRSARRGGPRTSSPYKPDTRETS